VGDRAVANGNTATAVGIQAFANGVAASAGGAGALANGAQAIAFGNNAIANGATATAFGSTANANSDRSTAVGFAANAVAAGSTALGYNSRANNPEDVALGSFSVTAAANPTSGAVVDGWGFTRFPGASPQSVVSVGSQGAERQITNVAAGRITPTSTDAVNGGQVYWITDTLSRKLSAGIASAMSMAAMPSPTEPGAWMVSGGFGYWHGQSGYSLGVAKTTDDGKWSFRAGGTVDSQGTTGASAGFGIQF
jgi:autotransporter adhesin